jgi:hypothetical protein
MLLQFLCGGIVRCNGMFDSAARGSPFTLDSLRGEEKMDRGPRADMPGADCDPFLRLGATEGEPLIVDQIARDIGTLCFTLRPMPLNRDTRDRVRFRFVAPPTAVTVDGMVQNLAFIIAFTRKVIR